MKLTLKDAVRKYRAAKAQADDAEAMALRRLDEYQTAFCKRRPDDEVARLRFERELASGKSRRAANAANVACDAVLAAALAEVPE
jgi:hypothetical protein